MMSGPLLPKGTPPMEEPTIELETTDQPEVAVDGHTPPSAAYVTAKNLLHHALAHPVVLDLCMLHKYGADWLVWEPETLEIRLRQDFTSSRVSDANLSKLQACKTVHLVDTYWDRWEVFGWLTMALNGFNPNFGTMQIPSVAQCMVGADVVQQLRDDGVWSSEVTAYLTTVHRYEGIFLPQPPLGFVHVESEGYPIDMEEIRRRWPAVRDSNHVPMEDSITGEQLRRLLGVHRELEASRASMRSQLPLVGHV